MQRVLLVCLSSLIAVAALCHEPGAAWGADKPKAEAEAGGHDDKSHDAGGHGDGKPSLPMNFKSDLALWSLITFVLFALILGKAAWGPLRTALDAREAGIAKNITDAESARIKAEQMLAEHERKLAKVQDEIKEMLAEARRDADTARANIVADATKEADATRQRALADIERAKNQALSELFDRAANRVIEASEHVLGRSLRDDDHMRLVEEALAQVSSKA